MHYYQHHIGDFIRDTSNLTDSQLAAYLRLIWMYYDTEKPLQNDVETLAFKIRASKEDVSLIIRHYFKLDADGMLQHSRCNAELLEYKNKSAKAADKANKRWSNAKDKQQQCNGNATASSANTTALKNDANQEPRTKNQEPIKKTSSATSSPEYTKSFLSFWDMYPNRKNKGAAFKAFKKINASEYPEIKEGLIRAKQSDGWLNDNGKYIPHPASWLNARGWEDEFNSVETAQVLKCPTGYPFSDWMKATPSEKLAIVGRHNVKAA